MSRESRIKTIAHGLRQCVERDPESLNRIRQYWEEKGQFAGHSMVWDPKRKCG